MVPATRERLPFGWTPSPAYPGRLGVAGSVLIEQAQTLHISTKNAAPPPVPTFDSPPTTVFAISALSSSSREHASPQARTSLEPPRTSTKNAAPTPVPTLNSAQTNMFATSASSQDGSRPLNCLIEGEFIIFVVTVGHSCVVSDLKEIQRERAMGTLKYVGPHTLELWKVSVIDESRYKVTWLTPTTG
jgi:Crinkler effector protein N-terminal domain